MMMVKKFLMMILVVGMAWMGAGILTPTSVAAADCGGTFLTFRPWYYGLTDDDCNIKTDFADDESFVAFVWTIILNILSILFGAVGYLAIGFLIAGGYFYVLARGDPNRIAKGKKTVISAIVGLVICILASLIANTIVNVLIGATTA